MLRRLALISERLSTMLSEESVSNWLDDNAELFGIKVDVPEPRSTNEVNRTVHALRQQDVHHYRVP
jgi:hypothetical protein